MPKQKKPSSSRKLRLQRALEEERRLETELRKLNDAQDPNDCALQIIKFIEDQGDDPMISEFNMQRHIPQTSCESVFNHCEIM